MSALFAAQLGVGLASAGASWWLGNKQADQQRAETREQLRRFRLQHQATLGEAQARGAASGIEFESQGLQRDLSDMETEFGRQEKWMLDAGMAQAQATETAAKFSFLTGGAGSFFDFAKNNNWWR
jgi:hypothetical protein